MPEFPGGMPGLMEFIRRNIRYPQAARQSQDLAEALRNAANAADDRNKLIAMRSEVAALAASASRAMDNCERRADVYKRQAF